MDDFVVLERFLGTCILGLLVSEGLELGGCEVGMSDAKDVNRFCVMKSGGDFLIGCFTDFDGIPIFRFGSQRSHI